MAKQKTANVNVSFADTYVGCNTLANIMDLHEETVRKRVKRGRIPGVLVKGKWTFQHTELVAYGILPFAANFVAATPVLPVVTVLPAISRVNRTDVFFVLDSSSSMSGLMTQARKNLQDQIDVLMKVAGPNDIYRITTIAFSDVVRRTLIMQDVKDGDSKFLGYQATSLYPTIGGMTAMNDAVLEALDVAASIPDDGQAFLVSIVTDGGENASKRIQQDGLSYQIAKRMDTGRYTFAYAGPISSEYYAQEIGIPAGNVTVWEQTFLGTQDLGTRSRSSLGTYTTSRTKGVMSSTSYYAQPVVSNPQDFANKLGQQLTKLDLSQFKVERVMDTDPVVIRTFCEAKLGGFQKGKIFYQLTESEKVQDYKGIVIQDTATGAFYSGWDAAAKLLGIPKFNGTVRIRPGKLGEFKVFIQSTSVNRKLKPGTAVVWLA